MLVVIVIFFCIVNVEFVIENIVVIRRDFVNIFFIIIFLFIIMIINGLLV